MNMTLNEDKPSFLFLFLKIFFYHFKENLQQPVPLLEGASKVKAI